MTIAASLALLAISPCLGQVVINEIHYSPSDSTAREEFVELVNSGDSSIDLGGWKLTGGIDFTFPANASIAAAGYVVVAQDPSALAARFPGVVALGPYSGKLGSDGETLVLREPSGMRHDVVEYQRGFPWPTAGGNANLSIELVNPSLDNDLGGSWRLADPGSGSVGELLAAGGLWRFLKGTTEASSPTSAWRDVDFDDFDWSEGRAPIGYGENFILTNLADMQGGYTSVFLRKRFSIADPSTIGRLTLLVQVDDGFNAWLNGVHVARHNLPTDEMAFDGAALAATEDLGFQTFELVDAARHLVAGENVLAIQLHNVSIGASSDAFLDARLVSGAAGTGPTPGRENAVFDANAPPQLRQVEHLPNEPRSGEAVTIQVKATDPDGIASVTLEYQAVNPGAYVRRTDPAFESGWTQLEMRDDGAAPDLVAGDGTFSALVPASLQAHRRLVRYRITAEDLTSRSVRVPYADDPQPNFAYFVHDGVPAWKGTSQPGVTPVQSFSTEVMRLLPVYHLLALESDVLKSQYDGAFEAVHFWGTMVYDGVVYDHIEFENRGEFSTYVSGKNKWRFHFQRGHEFQSRDDWGRKRATRWRTMNFSACSTPWVPPNRGMAGLDEAVAFRSYELAGVASPKTNYVHFRVIDESIEAHATDQYRGDLWGLYLTNEQTDGAFLDERGLADGNVYKIEGGGGDKRHQGPTQPTTTADYDAYRSGFNAQQPIQWWRANTDLPGYYGFRAGDRFLNNMDLRDGWNHCQYHDPSTGRWTAIPWDLDMLYMPTTHWPGVINVQNAIIQHQALRLEYMDQCRHLQDLFLTEDQFGRFVDELASFVSPPGMSVTFADVDEAMWNYNPRTASNHRGAFYRNPASQSFQGGVATRTLETPDHAGMARWIKDFALTGYGAARLQSEAVDAAIPNRPSIAYAGPPGFPLDELRFQCSPFSDPQGPATFAAMRWRVAELTPTDAPLDRTTPRRYEIEPTWESGVSSSFVDTIAVPVAALRIGALHRARVKFQDTTGRWSHWSEPVEFVVGPPAAPLPQVSGLRITEINFHPRDDLAEEFVEVQNIGAEPIDLTHVAFTEGIAFRFASGAVSTLAPGELVVVVESLDDFRARYGTAGIRIAGEYSGHIANSGERIVLAFGANLVIQEISLNDAWQPAADGEGYSLEIIDPDGPLSAWNEASGWRSSSEEGGTPGRAGDGPPPGGRQKAGDSNQDGALDLGDAISILFRLFVGGTELPCAGESASEGGNLTLLDVNGSGAVNLTDAVSVLNYLFLSGAPPTLGSGCVRIEGCPERCTP